MTIVDIFNDHIVAMEFDSVGFQLFVAGDRQIRVFNNVTGYRVGIELAKEKLKNKKISTAIQQRLEDQIEEYQEIIMKHSGGVAVNGNWAVRRIFVLCNEFLHFCISNKKAFKAPISK